MRRVTWGIVFAALAAVPANAAMDTLSDADLVNRASAVFSEKEPPADRILGVHRGNRVIVDVRCGDVCPAYTVRIIHYDIPAGPACSQIGGDSTSVLMPMGITTANQDFCVPHILYTRKLYTDRPYQH